MSILHSTCKGYQAEHSAVESLSNECRTNRSHPEPFFTSDFTNSEERPSIGKRTSEITKNTSEGDARNESENRIITRLILPEAGSREDLDDIENSSIENYTAKSEENNLSRYFPTIHFSEYISKNIGKWEENGPRIERKASKLRHLR